MVSLEVFQFSRGELIRGLGFIPGGVVPGFERVYQEPVLEASIIETHDDTEVAYHEGNYPSSTIFRVIVDGDGLSGGTAIYAGRGEDVEFPDAIKILRGDQGDVIALLSGSPAVIRNGDRTFVVTVV